MAESRIINVGGIKVGINGLDQALEDMAEQFADSPDDKVAEELLARLGRRNYFAAKARDEYAAALAREFRRHLGQPFEPAAAMGLEVRILGPGCPRCEQLYERVMKVVTEMGLAADVDKVKDTGEIAASGVLVTPGLMVNGKVMSSGKVPGADQIKSWLSAGDQGR